MVKLHRARRSQMQNLADAAQWSVVEQSSLGNAADGEVAFLATELYKRQRTPRFLSDISPSSAAQRAMIESLVPLSVTTHILAEKAQEQETQLRLAEMRW